MKAIGYVRCSTQEQVDSGLGLEVQASRIRAYCQMRKLDLVNIITDAGVSGAKPLSKRVGGLQLITAIKKRKAQSVVMLKLDRMFRNAADCLSTVEQWDKSGIGLHVVDLGGNAIDTTSAAGRFMLVVLAGAAEMERNLISERTKSAMAIKRANGKRIGTVPYGYDLGQDGNTLIPNSEEQETIKRITRLRDKGKTLQEIALALSESNVLTKTGQETWSHQTVHRILGRR